MRIITTLLIASIIFLSCQEKSDSDIGSSKEIELSINFEPPEMNLSTPDLAVKSFMKYMKWNNFIDMKIAENKIKHNQKYVNKYFTAEYPDTLKNLLKYVQEAIELKDKESRSITDVNMMTDTRAVVMQQTEEKTMGIYKGKSTIHERFTLTKENDKWLIEKIEQTCFLCDGDGKVRDYEYIYREVFKDCESCGGSGWRIMSIIQFE
ncbi:MAG: hypothetical protein DAHOPDDO_00611 [Ignavibacteriaceae bacterium]|nr:hypothetical protein [Ignavibacteriaceae bacterium]